MKQMKTNQTEFLCNNLLLSSSITKGAHMRHWDKKKALVMDMAHKQNLHLGWEFRKIRI